MPPDGEPLKKRLPVPFCASGCNSKTADPFGPAVSVCYQAKDRLLSDDRTGGASALASAAVDASASVNDGHAVLDLHSANRASALAGAAAAATLGNLMCHSRTLLSTRA